MSTDNPVAVVQRMLEAFEDRDLDRLVETVHRDSRWTYVGANPRPAKGIYVGRDGVREFFENIIQNLTITIFDASGKRLPTPLVDSFVDVGTGTFWLAGAWLGDSLVGGPGSRPRSRLFLTSAITANHLDFR